MQKLNKLVSLLLFVYGLSAPLHAQGIDFVRENIAVTIFPPDTIQIKGEYFFTSASLGTAFSELYYPFPVDSNAVYPCSIVVKQISDSKLVSFAKQEKGITFPVTAKNRDTTGIVIIYRQQVKNQCGTYILTTTSNWGKPLINSNYSVTIPKSKTLSYVSYECDTVATDSKNVIYKFFKKQFMPDRDLDFSWK